MNKDEIVLAIDYGDTNIGIAFGRQGLASPVRTVNAKDTPFAINEIAKTVMQNRAEKIVVGLPLGFDGKENMQSRKVRQFAKLLRIRLKKPVYFIDEYGSTEDSIEESIDNGLSKKNRRKVDHYSAAIILRHYFEQNE